MLFRSNAPVTSLGQPHLRDTTRTTATATEMVNHADTTGTTASDPSASAGSFARINAGSAMLTTHRFIHPDTRDGEPMNLPASTPDTKYRVTASTSRVLSSRGLLVEPCP